MERVSELERKYINEALDNQFSASKNGIFNSRLESAFGSRYKLGYAINHVNGTATMHTALKALGVGPEDEVIVPPLTMASTSLVVLQCGAVPVFADVDLNTFTLDPDSVLNCITQKTKAMISVSLYGLSPDYDRLLEICRKNNIALIEDNAECFLGKYKGKLVGQFGDFSSFSFQASKHMTCGDGGILLTDNEDLAVKARRFSSLGYSTIGAGKGKISKNDVQDPAFCRHLSQGYNYRMSELNAAAALGQFERLDSLVNQRIKAAELFRKAVQDSGILIPQLVPDGYINSYWCFAAYLNTDNPESDWYRFREIFMKNGGDGYYAAWKLTYQEPVLQNYVHSGIWQKYKDGLCPNAEYLQKRMLQFKTNYWISEDAEKQADILKKTIKEYTG